MYKNLLVSCHCKSYTKTSYVPILLHHRENVSGILHRRLLFLHNHHIHKPLAIKPIFLRYRRQRNVVRNIHNETKVFFCRVFSSRIDEMICHDILKAFTVKLAQTKVIPITAAVFMRARGMSTFGAIILFMLIAQFFANIVCAITAKVIVCCTFV